MPKISLSQFSGEIPRLISRLLLDTGSQHAENVRLDDGGAYLWNEETNSWVQVENGE